MEESIVINENDNLWLESIIHKIIEKMNWVSEKNSDKIPYTTVDGTYDNRAGEGEFRIDDGKNWWTNGFFSGIMWLMYHETKEERYAHIARKTEVILDECFDDFYGLHHDVGFMWLPSAVANYRLTGNKEARKRGMHAANLLAGRFNPVGKFIRAWNDVEGEDTRGWAIIDCMFNIPLLYWASEESRDPRFKHIAMMHADTVMETFIRADGSSNHIVEFNPFVGGVVKTYGGQGYEDGSAWTRGQSWALYGFVMSYIHTEKKEYLDTAKKVAHYFMANIPENGIIPVDFRQPKEPAWEDSCAATIAASGLIEIARYVGELEKDIYINAAIKILKTLDEKRCNWGNDCDAIVSNCSASYHSKEHHFTMIYADYFFIEAIFKLKENDVFLW